MMLVNVTWPRGVEERKESKSMAQPADSEDSVEVMCWSRAERVDSRGNSETLCYHVETLNIHTHLLYGQAASCPWEPLY